MASYSAFEQFARFGTDSYGLERTLRMVQASLQVISCYTLPFNVFLSLISLLNRTSPSYASSSPPPNAERVLSVLAGVRSRLALGRRFLRTFRFLDVFHGAWQLYSNSNSSSSSSSSTAAGQSRPAEAWLDIAGRSFNGMYLLLETAGLADALEVDGLAVWGPAAAAALHVEAQRFWFLALACGVGAGSLRLLHVAAYQPVPETGEGFGDGSKPRAAEQEQEQEQEKEKEKGEDHREEEQEQEQEQEEKEEKPGDGDEVWDWNSERERLRQMMASRKEQRRRWRRAVAVRAQGILRRLAADVLDLCLPGAVVGWVPASPGVVGLAMLGSTYLTSLEVWERCGRELAAARAGQGI